MQSFLEKNRDSFNEHISTVLRKSQSELVARLFAPQECKQAQQPESKNMMRKFNTSGNSLKGNTLSNQFRLQLQELIGTLKESSPRYIRCVKPNSNFSPTEFDSYDVAKQLRCAGMLEAIRIRAQGYAIRMSMEDFIKRYRPIFGPKAGSHLAAHLTMKEKCERILQEVLKETKVKKDLWQIGLTKVFMKEEARLSMEQVMGVALKKQIVHIQKLWRGKQGRARFAFFKAAKGKQATLLTKLVIRSKFRSLVLQFTQGMMRKIRLI